jgi:hypothetical protein
MLFGQQVFDSRYELSALHRVAFMAPLAGQEIIKWSTTTGATPVPGRVDFCLMHGPAFGHVVSLDLQFL